jgi:hypothetical protein
MYTSLLYNSLFMRKSANIIMDFLETEKYTVLDRLGPTN